MNNRQLYARVALSLVLLAAGRVVAGASGQDAACPACIATAIQPGQAVLLPDALHDLQVLIRVSSDMTHDLTAGIAAVRARGGRVAILVSPLATSTPDGIRRLAGRLADLRGRLPPGVPIGLQTDELEPGVVEGVAAYADVFVSRTLPQAQERRIWRSLGTPSIAEALEATRRGGHDLWVVDLPVDVVEARDWLGAVVAAATPRPDAVVDRVEVAASPRLTADEIVARHQSVARRQAASIGSTISTGAMTLTFEAPGFPTPLTITSDTVLYQRDDRTEVAQRNVRINGLLFRNGGVPRLPLIEPERVSAPPLTITLGKAYRYRRLGDETVAGVRCYVVAFEPVTADSAMAGRAWISMETWHLVRTVATQTRLRGPIVSSEQVDDFRELVPGTWLLVRSDVRQLYEGAGHRTPIHRLVEISAAEVNPPDFDARVDAAYDAAAVMLRQTAAGYRYVRRESSAGQTSAVAGSATIVEERADRVRTLAGGVIVDPNISVPLPFAGLNYSDFDLFGTGMQFTGFFGGSYGQLAMSIPSLAGSRWQAGGRAFALATAYNDRAFREGLERFDENLRQRPAHASAWLLRPVTRRLTFRAGYEFDYVQLRRTEGTAAAFGSPADQVVHGLRVSVEGQRGGWAGAAWWNPARRTGWHHWGTAADYDERHEDFQRFGASLSRTTLFGPAFVTRVEAAMMAGRDLDRFSRFAFGSFDNRLRGYPSASVRYDRGAVVRGSASWSFSSRARLDLFADTAVVRDRGFGTGYRNYTGTGAAIEAPLPFGILGAAEWGYGFRGVNGDGSLGTQVIRVSVFKVF